MAIAALCALLAGVCVIVPVTGGAGHVEAHLARRPHVTRCARRARVRAAQREAGRTSVVERCRAPFAFAVALLAGGAVAPLVSARIVVAMAGGAVACEPDLPSRPGVAGAALDRRVPAAQRKARSRMIEPRRAPAGRRVTRAAVSAEAPAVRVVLPVARHTRRRRPVIAFVGVTGCAARREMRARQRKSRLRVIEADAPPSILIMAAAATHAEAAPVRLVGAVTVYARGRRVTMSAPGHMA